jgi:hypothetical protein
MPGHRVSSTHYVEGDFLNHRVYHQETFDIFVKRGAEGRLTLKSIADAHYKFELSGQAYQMFSEIVDLLKSAPRLEKISVGHNISASSNR